VSFHWPLPGYLALLPLVPALLARWPRPMRLGTWATAAAGLVLVLGYYAAVSSPAVRARFAAEKFYPANFAGWQPLADAVRTRLKDMPDDTLLVADNFKIGAELGFALDHPDIPVLDHPLNRKHGRAPQLRLWGLASDGRADWEGRPSLLVVGASELPYKDLLAHYHALCARVGPLPPPQQVDDDHGRQRFLLFALPARRPAGPCTTPALAWFDLPAPGARVGRRFNVSGWAFKDGVGIARVEVTIDGKVVAEADYGSPRHHVAPFWKISTDAAHPDVGFDAQVRLPPGSIGLHWLGLRLHGKDGSVERWPEQPLHVAAAAD
jgi:hypothetical protein